MPTIEAISTTYLEADAASVTFSSIPATYEHLQLRFSPRSTSSGAGHLIMYIQFGTGGGAVDTGTNYSTHYMRGTGTTADASAVTGAAYTSPVRMVQAGEVATLYSPTVVDILDYANANKNTTIMAVTSAMDAGSYPELGFGSGLWDATGAVDRIKLSHASSFTRGSEFTLYGLKSS